MEEMLDALTLGIERLVTPCHSGRVSVCRLVFRGALGGANKKGGKEKGRGKKEKGKEKKEKGEKIKRKKKEKERKKKGGKGGRKRKRGNREKNYALGA